MSKMATLKKNSMLLHVLAEDDGVFWCRSAIGRKYFTLLASDLELVTSATQKDPTRGGACATMLGEEKLHVVPQGGPPQNSPSG